MDKNEKKIIKLEEKIKQTLNEIDEKWRKANSEYKNSPEYDRKRFENEIKRKEERENVIRELKAEIKKTLDQVNNENNKYFYSFDYNEMKFIKNKK